MSLNGIIEGILIVIAVLLMLLGYAEGGAVLVLIAIYERIVYIGNNQNIDNEDEEE